MPTDSPPVITVASEEGPVVIRILQKREMEAKQKKITALLHDC